MIPFEFTNEINLDNRHLYRGTIEPEVRRMSSKEHAIEELSHVDVLEALMVDVGEHGEHGVRGKTNYSASSKYSVADLTYVVTWKGFADMAFVIDMFLWRIVGWGVMASLKTTIALDALEQVFHGTK